jgi:hypothetical protein
MAKDDSKLPSRATEGAVAEFLTQVARVPPQPGTRRGRLLFAIDATASREPTWDMASKIQGEMFSATGALGGLEVQLLFYRGFGECKTSAWVSSPAALVKQMSAVQCLAGETQIAKLLRHAIAETRKKRINAVVFVGDAMEESMDRLCGLAGELGLLGVPLFIFHEGRDAEAERAFREMARLSRGAYCPFDAGSAHQLKELLGAVAVYAAGGIRALEAYGRKTGGLVPLLTRQVK